MNTHAPRLQKLDCKHMKRSEISNLFRAEKAHDRALAEEVILDLSRDASIEVNMASPNQYRDILLDNYARRQQKKMKTT